jgi:integrase
MALESSHDRSKYNPTGVPGLEYRWRADGSKTFYGFVPSRGRMKLNSRKQREARAELNELLGKAAKGETVAPVNKRFKDVAEEWLASKRKLRPWTRRSYRAALDLVLIPRFGHLKIGAVSTSLIASLIRDLEAKGLNAIDSKRPVRPLSQAAIDNYLKPLSGTLRFAVSKGLVGTNAYLALTSDERPDTDAGRRATYEWSDEEIKAVLDASEIRGRARESQYDYSPLIRLAIYTGLRLGELLGLRWCDLDFEAAVLHVRQQWTRVSELAPPKTKKGVRRVPLSADLVAFLRKHKLASKFSTDEDFVFASKTGGPLAHRNVQRRAWEPVRKLAELPDHVTFHDLRHAFASVAASREVPVTVLSGIMGHSDVGVTQRVYIHLFGREHAEEAFRKAMAETS